MAITLTEQCGEALREIVSLAEVIADQVQGIATASEHQSLASEEIAKPISEVSIIAEETTHAMRDTSQAIIELASQTDKLSSLITHLK